MDDFSAVSRWPASTRHPGIADGWHGPAWVWLTLVEAGLVPGRASTIAAIVRRLRAPARSRDTSIMVGSAAAPVIAVKLAQIDAGARALADACVAGWTRRLAARSGRSDVMRGTAGALLAAAEIVAIRPGMITARAVAHAHARCARALAASIAGAAHRRTYLGLAHGIAGYVLALENTAAAFGLRVPADLRRAALAVLEREVITASGSDAAFWAARSRTRRLDLHGWCSGAPGVALALAASHALSGRTEYRRLACRALLGAAALVAPHPSVCCGFLGQALVLAEASRLLTEPCWAAEAERVARALDRRVVASRKLARGLWGGRPGYDLVAWRLRHRHLPVPGLGVLSWRRAERRS